MRIPIILIFILFFQNTSYAQCEQIVISPFKGFVVCGMINHFTVNVCNEENLDNVEFIATQHDYKFDAISAGRLKQKGIIQYWKNTQIVIPLIQLIMKPMKKKW